MTANEALDRYMNSLGPSERRAKSRDIRAKCRISKYVLSYWRRGRTPIPWSVLDKINEAIGENLFENVTN